MTERYRSTNGIHPFIVAPGEGALQQRLAVAPERLVPYPDVLTDLVSKFTLQMGPEFPIISQVQWYRGFLVLSITVQTPVPETFSGRKGLNVTFGALVSPTEMGRHDLSADIFGAFRRYFQSTFGGDISVEAVSQVISAKHSSPDPWNVGNLRWAFESFLTAWQPSAFTRAARPFRRLFARLRLSRVAPLSVGSSVDEALRYWSIIDKALEPREELLTAERSDGKISQTIALSLITLCIAQFLEFAAVAWPSAPRNWRSVLALSGSLVILSIAFVIGNVIRNIRSSPMLLKIAGFVAATAVVIAFVVALISLNATLR